MRWSSINSRSAVGAALSTYTIVLNAIRQSGLMVSSGRRWTQAQYQRALSVGRSALVAKKIANATGVSKTKVNQILAANGMLVQGKTGVYYLRRGGKWVKPTGAAAASALGPISATYKPGTVPQNFVAKQSLVKRAFIAARNRHAAAIQAQGVTDVNYTKANELAMYEVRAAGLPTDQIRISTSGTLLAGTCGQQTCGRQFSGRQSTDHSTCGERSTDHRSSIGDWDWAQIELQEIRSKLEPEEGDAMYDPELWIDEEEDEGDDKDKKKGAEDEDAEELKMMDEIEDEGPSFETTEEDLWLRPEVAGADMGAEATFFNAPTGTPITTATTSYVQPTFVASPPFQTWWNTITWFRNITTPIINATTPTAAAATAAIAAGPAGGGGSYGGGGGGGGGGEGDGGGGGEAEEAAEESEEEPAEGAEYDEGEG
jgi:hypothetical protein